MKHYTDTITKDTLPLGNNRRNHITAEAYKEIESWFNKPSNKRITDLFSHINRTYPTGMKLNTFRRYLAKHFSKQIEEIKFLHIEIKESFTELESLLETCLPFMKPRIRMLILLKKENRMTYSALSQKASIAYNSAVKWHNLYVENGLDKLMEMKRGRDLWGKYTLSAFPLEVFRAIEIQHKREPFKNYMELFRWVSATHLPEIKYTLLLKRIHQHFGNRFVIDRALDIRVKEPVKELESLYSQSSPRIKPRLRMLIVLKNEMKINPTTLAIKTGATYGSILKWIGVYEQRGLSGILKSNQGAIITNEVHTFIKTSLNARKFEKFSGLHNWVKKNYIPGINYNTLHRYVWRNFHKELKIMKSIPVVPVKETTESLNALFKISAPSIRIRLKMLQVLKANPFISRTELSKELDTTPASIKKWYTLYENGGLESLVKSRQRGRKKFVMPQKAHAFIEKCLNRNPYMSITELYNVVNRKSSYTISYNKLYRYVKANIQGPAKINEHRKRAA